MSSVAPAVEPVGPARTSGFVALLEQTRYVLGENKVTGFSFALLIIILLAAVFGPYVVPYDPLASDFVRTARASGLSPFTVIVTYAFRNAMLPVVTTLGMVFSFLLGANVLVEKVFAWPGIGSFAVEALIASDFAPVQGFVLTMAVMYVALNLLIDILYGLIDPRVRIEA